MKNARNPLRYLPILLLGIACLSVMPPLRAQPLAKPVMTTTADLLGNGKRETISVHTTNKNEIVTSLTVSVDAAKLTVTQTDQMEGGGGLEIRQIDSGSRSRQILVRLNGPDDIAAIYVFGYDGNHIVKIGMFGLQGKVGYPGNGAIYAEHWMGFWSLQDKYVVDVKTYSLREVPQPLYYVGKTTTVTASFPIRHDQSATSAIVADVAKGSRITVLLYSSANGSGQEDEPNGWYLIKTQSGLCGWAQLKTFQDKQNGLSFAG